jgi:hypothetical protein
MPCSIALSSNEVDASESLFSISFSLTGAMKARVKGTMHGRSAAAAMLSLNALELVSSDTY